MTPRKAVAILDAARVTFLERGYDGTSLDEVAARSGVSKTTVYNNFADKERLFAAVVLSVTERAEQIIEELASILRRSDPFEQRLQAVARTLAHGVLNPTVVQLRRLAISEALRFPDIVATYWDRAPGRTLALLSEAFSGLTAEDDLAIADTAAAAGLFAYALLGSLQDEALLRPGRPVSSTEVDDHADRVVAAFLRAYRR